MVNEKMKNKYILVADDDIDKFDVSKVDEKLAESAFSDFESAKQAAECLVGNDKPIFCDDIDSFEKCAVFYIDDSGIAKEVYNTNHQNVKAKEAGAGFGI